MTSGSPAWSFIPCRPLKQRGAEEGQINGDHQPRVCLVPSLHSRLPQRSPAAVQRAGQVNAAVQAVATARESCFEIFRTTAKDIHALHYILLSPRRPHKPPRRAGPVADRRGAGLGGAAGDVAGRPSASSRCLHHSESCFRSALSSICASGNQRRSSACRPSGVLRHRRTSAL